MGGKETNKEHKEHKEHNRTCVMNWTPRGHPSELIVAGLVRGALVVSLVVSPAASPVALLVASHAPTMTMTTVTVYYERLSVAPPRGQ